MKKKFKQKMILVYIVLVFEGKSKISRVLRIEKFKNFQKWKVKK